MYFFQTPGHAPSTETNSPSSEPEPLTLLAPDHSNAPLPVSPTDSGPLSPAAQSECHPETEAAFDEPDNDDSDPDPGCLDLNPSNDEDCSVSGPRPANSSVPTLPNYESIFEDTHLEDLLTAINFIRALQSASHDDPHCKMDRNAIKRMRNPPTVPVDIGSSPDIRLGLDLFLANMNSSVKAYNANRDAFVRRYPMNHVPSYEQMKRHVCDITGVNSVVHPMCKNSCLAFTGPFANLDFCPKCNEPKLCPYTKKPQQEFHTILLGPILQALWRDASSAKQFYYRRWKTWEIIRELQANSGNLSSYDDFL